MGCGGTKSAENLEESSHKITSGGFEKGEKIDISFNPNEYITSSTNYYKNQDPGSSRFSDNKFPPTIDTFFGKREGQYTDPDEGRRSRALRAIKISQDDIEWKPAKEIWGEDAKLFGDKISLEDIKNGEVADAYCVAT